MMYVIILAAGKGERAGGGVPKQFRELRGKPVYAHSLDTFRCYSPQCECIIVLPQHHSEQIHIPEGIRSVKGGASRFQSVRAALEMIAGEAADDDIVAIHDGARPLVSSAMIADGIKCLETEGGGVIPFTPVTDSIRHLESEGESVSVDRSRYVAVKTPQIFRFGEIAKAYAAAGEGNGFTDDASVYESMFPGKIHLYPGNADNIKITNPKDFAIAEILLR